MRIAVEGMHGLGKQIGKNNMTIQTPPNNLRELIDSIATKRGVTLYKDIK